MLIINNLQFERDDKALFSPINLRLAKSACLQLCGPNGVGKTTVLRILAGLAQKRRGAILWQDKNIPSLLQVSKYLGHELALKNPLTVFENLQYYATLMQTKTENIEKALAYFDLIPLRHRQIHSLSAGQKQRCQLAKLLIGKADFWLLDEPFTALDQHHVAALLNLFSFFIQDGGRIIFTSHHPLQPNNFTIDAFFIEPAA